MRSRQGSRTNHTQPTHRQPNHAQRKSSKAQKARTTNTNTTSEEHDDIPNMGMPPDKIMTKLKNHTPVGYPPLSRCLFTNRTPENLYGVRTKKGPQPLGAVGGTVVMGGDTWACQPLTTRGSREILIGIEVPRITTDFPMIDLQEATRELKSSTDDRKIQALTVPEQVGGHVDVLLGIQYSAHFPKLVHSLESELGIYEVKLLASDPHVTAAIAGPHHSFNMMLEKIGDTGAMLSAFTQGLNQWKLFGPPPIKSMYPDTRDLGLATESNNDSTLLTAPTSAEHITPLSEEYTPAPRKTQKNQGRPLTDSKEDTLDSYNADDELVIRTCSEDNTAEAFQDKATDTTTTCRILQCNGCNHNPCNQPIELTEQEYLELNADVLETRGARNNHTNLHITTNSYKISIEQPVDEFGPDIPTMKTRSKSAVDEASSKLGAKIKGWAISGQEPAQEISEDGFVGVARNAWHPMTDSVELKLQPLHSGRVIRGRLHPVQGYSLATPRQSQTWRTTSHKI